MSHRHFIEPRHRELARVLVEQWQQTSQRSDKWYRVIPVDPTTGRIRRAIVKAKRVTLTALIIEGHNMSKTAIYSRPGVTSLQLLIDLRTCAVGAVRLNRARSSDVKLYLHYWPDMRSLLDEPSTNAGPAGQQQSVPQH